MGGFLNFHTICRTCGYSTADRHQVPFNDYEMESGEISTLMTEFELQKFIEKKKIRLYCKNCSSDNLFYGGVGFREIVYKGRKFDGQGAYKFGEYPSNSLKLEFSLNDIKQTKVKIKHSRHFHKYKILDALDLIQQTINEIPSEKFNLQVEQIFLTVILSNVSGLRIERFWFQSFSKNVLQNHIKDIINAINKDELKTEVT